MTAPAAREVAERLAAAGLGPLLAAARERVERLDGVRGTVRVDLPPEAVEALAGLMGWKAVPLHPRGGPVVVRLQDLDQRLRQSRYRVGLLEVLEAHGGPLVTRRQREEAAARQWQEQLAAIRTAAPPAARDWAASLEGDGPSARWYRRAYREDPATAREAALAVARALAALPCPPGKAPAGEPAEGELLAVFAARVTGDPHAFDPRRPAGALLLVALEELFGPPPPGLARSEARALLLGQAGLEVDSLSSTVLAAHLHGADHPVVAAMAAAGGGWPLPLAAVRRLRFAPGTGPAFVVENPQVFEYLVRGAARLPAHRRPPLVCPAGFPSAAAVRLLDALHGAGYTLYYSGDFDQQGLTIARWVLERYPRAVPWRMRPDDYRRAAGLPGAGAAEALSAAERAWLEALDGPLADTARAMAAAGRPAYQERLVDVLLADLLASGAGAGQGCGAAASGCADCH
ncbi:MAG: TIGR02679 family protein [Bacillota bacterium]|nr:MAG: TIGR02679 family protein [Bacillota bacterium]